MLSSYVKDLRVCNCFVPASNIGLGVLRVGNDVQVMDNHCSQSRMCVLSKIRKLIIEKKK